MIILSLLMLSATADAKIHVATTLPSFADIASNVGGDEVDVKSLTRGTQDPHFVDAKPDLILSLRNADLLLHAGLGLEDGWLPPLVTGSRNGKIQAGSPGNLNVSTVIQLREIPTVLDRAQGDVHPGGNPHYMADPRNGIVLAHALAERFAKLEPSKTGEFDQRADAYAKRLETKIKQWSLELKPLAGKKVATYHKSWSYFLAWSGLVEAGTVEPKPGIPPSPSHTVQLIRHLKSQGVKAILMEPFYPKGVAEDVANASGAKVLVLPMEVHGSPQAKSYLNLFDEIVSKLLEVLR